MRQIQRMVHRVFHRAPHHGGHQIFFGKRTARENAVVQSILEHRYTVGQLHDILQKMGDEYDGHALLLELGDDFKKEDGNFNMKIDENGLKININDGENDDAEIKIDKSGVSIK